MREGPPQPAPHPAEKARGGEIILKTPARRAIFFAGLIGAVVLILVLALVRQASADHALSYSARSSSLAFSILLRRVAERFLPARFS